ncbi:MAG: hypothetical protein RMA76_41200 [Deltaproteobacteria bacterium]|jgi:hypothetical protein
MSRHGEIGAALAGAGAVMAAVAQAQAASGASAESLGAIKGKMQANQPLTDVEKAQVRAFGEALRPALAKVGGLDDGAKKMADQIVGHIDEILTRIAA